MTLPMGKPGGNKMIQFVPFLPGNYTVGVSNGIQKFAHGYIKLPDIHMKCFRYKAMKKRGKKE
jgi:hypothetical protein